MGASRAALSKSQPKELTTQEKARRDWINEQRGIKDSDTPSQPRMAGGLPGIMGVMASGAFANRPGWGGPERRSKETRDWIDQQRGVEVQPDNKSSLRSIFGFRTTADRQRRQDRNSWLDEQIRKSREEEEAQKVSAANQPMTEDERRGYLNTEVETRKDMWD
jgi:hypothetical protein